ncbi:hypothetical protein H8E77_41250 [bacterium]|nr:hypothetical protein [bacterium]
MSKSFVKGILVGIVIAGIVSMGISLVANEQEEKKPEYTTLVLGKLKLNPTGGPEVAEKLLTEKLIPAAKEIQGLKITALKWMSIPGQEAQKKPSQPDYVMMAEMVNVNVFMQLIASHSTALQEYGEQMKAQAGKPDFELYQILGTSEE